MSAPATRLLLLGAVQIFEPVNGYQIRRELVSWRIDEWAHINPGSIYSVLRTLTKQGFVERHDLDDGGREVAVYTMTSRGRAEFVQLMERAVTTVDLVEPRMLHTALAMLSHLERTTVSRWLATRVERLHELLGQAREQDQAVPPHVLAMVDLWRYEARAHLEWCEALLRRVEVGELDFAGEPGGWTPPEDDPGWQMVEDRERYRRLLGQA